MKFAEASRNYLGFVQVTKSDGTYRFTRDKLNILDKYIGHKLVTEIGKNDILKFIIEQRDRNPDISNSTLNKYVQVIKRVLKNECGIIIRFEKLPEEKKLIQIVHEKDIRKIYKYLRARDTLENQRNLLMFMLFHDTGLRISELLNLKVKDFNFEKRSIHVRITKTKTERYVFFTSETLFLLNKLISENKLREYIFINFETRTMLSVDSVEKICQRIQKALRIKTSISPHKWRHTFATNFLLKHGNMEVLRMLMGHTSLKTTQKYLHVNMDNLHKEYNRVLG